MLLSKYKKKISYLIERKKKKAGRNNTGRITVAHQGSGHKQLYRQIDFQENLNGGMVIGKEYDPNRSSHLAKICFKNKHKIKKYHYIICPKDLKILDIITSNNITNNEKNNQKQLGNFYFLKDFSIGDFIYNIEILPNRGGQLVRSAGTFAKVLQKDNGFVSIVLPSGEHRLIPEECKACLGIVSNENHNNIVIKKAGRSR